MTKKKFAIIGNPIEHSLSPILHNYWFKKYKIEAEYTLLKVDEKNLENTIKKIRNKEFAGINVTLPYKQKVIPFLDRLINDAKITNSVNTIFLDETNTLVGENTDVYGVQAAYLKEIVDVEKKGFSYRRWWSITLNNFFTSKSKISDITVVNRTHDKSIFLKKKFNLIKILDWGSLKDVLAGFDIIINATSLGLKNGNDFDFNFDNIKNDAIFIDTIYNPIETKTLKYLKQNKIKTFNGLNMFLYQGQKSFYMWNKINPEINNELLELLVSKLK